MISNECFSLDGSNGRTIRNLLRGWPIHSLAQFYIIDGQPDFEICQNYYHISDGRALRALIGKLFKSNRTIKAKNKKEGNSNSRILNSKRIRRNALTMLIREFVWGSNCWKTTEYKSWIQSYNPELVLLQAGDFGFMYELATDVAEKFSIPLVIYNSEGYFFKKYDYFRSKGIAHFCYPIFRKILCNKFEKAIKRAGFSIYNCEELKKAYDKVFNLPSATIYASTEIKKEKRSNHNKPLVISYLGNLGVGRVYPLIEVANTLQGISEQFRLNIYGKTRNEKIERLLNASSGIRYHGFVPYDEVIRVIHNSDIIIHVENFSTFYRKDLKYGFSTKIADSLASGSCFLLYAPEEIACAQYLKKNNAAYVASNQTELKSILTELLNDPKALYKYQDSADLLVANNHNVKTNKMRFQQILLDIVRNK